MRQLDARPAAGVGAVGCDVGVVKGVVVVQGAVCGVWGAEPVLRQAMGGPGKCQPLVQEAVVGVKRQNRSLPRPREQVIG